MPGDSYQPGRALRRRTGGRACRSGRASRSRVRARLATDRFCRSGRRPDAGSPDLRSGGCDIDDADVAELEIVHAGAWPDVSGGAIERKPRPVDAHRSLPSRVIDDQDAAVRERLRVGQAERPEAHVGEHVAGRLPTGPANARMLVDGYLGLRLERGVGTLGKTRPD